MKKVVDDLKTTSKNSMIYTNENSMVRVFKDWLFEESKKADSKAFHIGEQFNLGYAAGLDACYAKFIEYIGKSY